MKDEDTTAVSTAESDDQTDSHFHIEARQDPLIGTKVGDRYQIISVVGHGGMGTVYQAEHSTINRTVAVKMLHPHLTAQADALQRFRQEALAVSRIEHAHCARIFDFGVTEVGQPYIVMEFVAGDSLRQLLRKNGPLALPRAAGIFAQVTEALECAHTAGIIHRDLKPENIMLAKHFDNEDHVWVVDFGISSLTGNTAGGSGNESQQPAETRGSPRYMSPEQCRFSQQVDARSDIYSLAVVLYECLSGRLPYNGRTALELLEAHVNAQPLPLKDAHTSLSTCQTLTTVLQKSLEKDPAKRQQTIQEFSVEIKDAVRRDLIHLNSLKNRKEQLDSSDHHPALKKGELPSPASTSLSQLGFWQVCKNLLGLHNNDKERESSYSFVSCPYCSEPVEPGIAFCLACSHSLLTIQDFSKVRSAQGVFTLPRAKDANTGATTSAHLRKSAQLVPPGGQSNTATMLIWLLIIAVSIFIFLKVDGQNVIQRILSGLFDT